MDDKSIIVYTDGGSRGNPGKAAYGFIILVGGKIIYGEGSPLGIATNNVAEYEAIVHALEWIHSQSNREKIGPFSGIIVRMDSLLACQQLKGVYKVKSPHLAAYLIKIKRLEKEMDASLRYEHVPREKNQEADALVNRALDVGVQYIGESFFHNY